MKQTRSTWRHAVGALLVGGALLEGCTPPPPPVVAGPPASAEPATREQIERLMKGHRTVQGRWVHSESDPDVALLSSLHGKSLTIVGKVNAEKTDDDTVVLSADTDSAGRVFFAPRYFGSEVETDAFLRAIPAGAPATITFNVIRADGRWVDGTGTPFEFVRAAPR